MKKSLSLVLCLAVLAGGCATRALWKTGLLDAYNEPDEIASLRLFQMAQTNDLLVVYKEYSERHEYSRARAYLLYKNEERVQKHRRPHFVETNLLSGLTSVPLFFASNVVASPPPKPYAIVSTNGQSFRLFSAEGSAETYELPVYSDGWGKWERVALTPVSVAADISIVGGVIGYFVIIGLAESNTSIAGP